MIKPVRLVFLAVLASVLMVGVVSAANVHWNSRSGPASYDNGSTLTVADRLSGLGKEPVLVSLAATGNPTADCTNPSGLHQPAGQNPASITLTGTQSIPAGSDKNGWTPILVTTLAPVSPVAGAPECPGHSWTENITGVAFTTMTVTVTQGPTVLVTTCTFSPPTSDGKVTGAVCQ